MRAENHQNFLSEMSASIADKTFVKATFGNYRGNDPHLQKLLVRLLETKKGTRLFVLYRYDTRDTAKNYRIEDGLQIVSDKLGTEFFAGHLFTTAADFQLDVGKKGKSRLNRSKPTFVQPPDLSHDREKRRIVNPDSFFLKALGVANESGSIKPRQQQKWKQINKFVEILGSLLDEAGIGEGDDLKLTDMGCGKGYLTFAAFDYLKNARKLEIELTGIDTNPRLMDLCNEVAETCGFTGLAFQTGSIAGSLSPGTDVLIALHACNTATDDAIYRGISEKAKIILVSPCCHKEIRQQIKPPAFFRDTLKHGTLLERQAELITDALRALILEIHGYRTKVFEFVPSEHTPKNNMIAAVLSDKPYDRIVYETQVEGLKDVFGIESFRLEQLLADSRE